MAHRTFTDNALTWLINKIKSIGNNAITALSASGTTITYTKGDGTSGTITTQDTVVNSIAPLTVTAKYKPQALSDATFVAGKSAKAQGLNNIAIGTSASALNVLYGGGVAIGTSASASAYAVAVGKSAKASASKTVAVGSNTEASANGAAAFGNGATASGTGSVALGDSSQALETGVVSVGYTGATRRIVNVTDPVNAQDAATKNYVDSKVTSRVIITGELTITLDPYGTMAETPTVSVTNGDTTYTPANVISMLGNGTEVVMQLSANVRTQNDDGETYTEDKTHCYILRPSNYTTNGYVKFSTTYMDSNDIGATGDTIYMYNVYGQDGAWMADYVM